MSVAPAAQELQRSRQPRGPWDDLDGALKKYLDQKEALHAGRKPKEVSTGVTVKDLCNAFLNYKQAKLDAQELSPRTWINYKETADLLINGETSDAEGEQVDVKPTLALKAMILLGVNCGFGNFPDSHHWHRSARHAAPDPLRSEQTTSDIYGPRLLRWL